MPSTDSIRQQVSNSAHTPGPWRVEDGMIEAECGRVIGDVCTGLTKGVHRVGSREEQRANATLIAAAPELLESLKCMIDYYEMFRGICPKGPTEIDDVASCKAVVAKAEGGA